MSKVDRKPPSDGEAPRAACASLVRDATRCLERAAIFEYLLREVVPHFVPEPGGSEPAQLIVALTGGPRPADINAVVDVEQELLGLAERNRARAETVLGLQVALPNGMTTPIVDEAAEPLSSSTVPRRSVRRDQAKG